MNTIHKKNLKSDKTKKNISINIIILLFFIMFNFLFYYLLILNISPS